MNYPLSILLDKTAQDIEVYVSSIAKQRGINADMLELVMYKVLSKVQADKITTYMNENINNLNNLDDMKKEEVDNG